MSEKHLNTFVGDIELNSKGHKNVKFEEAMEFTGFGKYNIMLIMACGLALYGVNSEAYSVGFIIPSAQCDLNLNTTTKGILTSTNFIGIMGSCCLWGYLSDTKGRRNLLMISLFLAFVSSVVAGLVPSFAGFAFLRLLNGIFISGPSAVIFAYFGEFHSRSYRSRAMAFMSFFIGIALVALPGLGWVLLPQHFKWEFLGMEVNAWRLFMMLQAIPNLIVSIIFTRLSESPEYLYYSGNADEALRIMRRIYAVNTGRPEETFPVESLQEKIILEPKPVHNIIVSMWKSIVPLFSFPHLKYILSACIMQGSVFAISSGLLLWYPEIVNQLSNGGGRDAGDMTVCSALALSQQQSRNGTTGGCTGEIDDDVFIQNLIIGAAYLFGYAAWGFVVKFLGNRNFFIFCMGVSTAALVLLNFLTQKTLIDILFVVLLVLPGICVAVVSTAMVEIIPTHLCGMAVCITMTAGRLGSVVSSSIVGITLQYNCTMTFLLYALSLSICLLLAFVFPKHPAQHQSDGTKS